MEKNEFRLEPFRDNEVKDAIHELFSMEHFVAGTKSFLPPPLFDHIMDKKDQIETVFDFQSHIIYPVLQSIKNNSITELTVRGLETLDKNQRYLFISNHRDIVLDSAFLNVVLFDNDCPTSQIAIGDNLMQHRISELIFRLNKSFVVKRSGSPRELYGYSVNMSNYIKDLITNKKDSVWIAQREGRAKDGNDQTQVGLLKMLSLSERKEIIKHFKSLNVVPVAISYEYDPCGLLKTKEFIEKQKNPDYKKSFQDDLQNMLLGLTGLKGRVHFQFGQPLNETWKTEDENSNGKKQLELIAAKIDQAIHTNFQLHPINYIAHDLLMGNQENSAHYSDEEFDRHTTFFEEQIELLDSEDQPVGQKYLLEMYANPLINANSYHSKIEE